ncbi:MAG: hypothetical protein JKY30_03655, partial [Flavobacteriales bacterium]|nr:hypothetical protein [Flavobacteriales bacterium]
MKKTLYLFLITSLIFSANNSFSQALKKINLNTKVTQSQVIVEGKVISKESFWDANHYNIYTANKIEVYKVFKGSLTTSIIEIITPGGTVGLQRDVVEPSLSLSYNETGIFMLRNNTVNYLTTNTNPQFEPYSSVQGF